MKTLILGAALALCATTASADMISFCTSQGDLAETFMEVRQNGVPITKLLKVAQNEHEGSGDEWFRQFHERMILAAYDYPRYSSPEYQIEARQDFRNEVEMMCIAEYHTQAAQ